MAHGIMENDGMFSGNGIRPWHGLGTIIDGCPTSDEAIKLANLGWEVVQEPVCLQDGTVIPNFYANVRSDTKGILGMVQNKYRIVQNKEAFEFTDNIIKNTKGIECRYETAGSLFNGKRTFLLVRLPETDLVGDAVENYLFVTNSHDGTTGLIAGITNVRIVCNNTLQLAINGAQRTWNLRHTESIKGKQAEAEQALGLALNYSERVKEDAIQLAAKKVREEAFFRELFKKMNLSEKSTEKVGLAIADIYHNKEDLQNFKGTAWGLYNAVADFVSNGEPLRKTSTSADWKMANFMNGYSMLSMAEDILKKSA
jgi:phage/plasmid-like protein (TIGR03299 family)